MKLRALLPCLLLSIGGYTGLAAQTVTLSQSTLVNSTGQPFTGTIQICPVTNVGLPIAYHRGGGGTVTSACGSATVTNGAWTATVPDTFLTNPQNVCLALTAQDPVTYNNDLPRFTCVQPSNQAGSGAVTAGWCTEGGSCDLDLYTTPSSEFPVEEISGGGGGATFNGGDVSTPITAPGFNSGPSNIAVLGTDATTSSAAALTFNASLAEANMVGLTGSNDNPGLWLRSAAGGGFVFTEAATQIAQLTASGFALSVPLTLPSTPTQCGAGYAPTGIDVHGGATGCWQPASGTFSGGTVSGATTFVSTAAFGPSGVGIVGQDATTSSAAALTFNGSLTESGMVGATGSNDNPGLFFWAKTGGGFDFNINAVSVAQLTASGFTLPADPSSAMQAATKEYVDNRLNPGDVGAAQAADSGSRFAAIANSLIAQNHAYFNDGTNFYYAGSSYHTYGEYSSDLGFTMLAFPGHFTSADFLNFVDKFIAARNTGSGPANIPVGDLPETINQDGTANMWCSPANLYCHYAAGDTRLLLPLVLYLYYQRTGDLTPYTTNVGYIKTAMAIPPRDGEGAITVSAGAEEIPATGYLEFMHGLGAQADATVLDAWDAKAMELMATAAGDATNATAFTTQYSDDVSALTSELTDGTSKLLVFSQSGGMGGILDVVDSTLALYPLLGPGNGSLITGSQATSISDWLNTNYSSIVNAEGYVKLVNSCPSNAVGQIPASGSSPYTYWTWSDTQYQCGYWATFGGYFAYALGLTNPGQATTYLQTYLGGPSPTAEHYDQGNNTPQGEPALMTAGQSMRMASELFPAPVTINTGLCVVDSGGSCTNYIGTNAYAAGALTVPTDFTTFTTITSTPTQDFGNVDATFVSALPTGDHVLRPLGTADSTNNMVYFGFVNTGVGSANNYGALGSYNNAGNDTLTWFLNGSVGIGDVTSPPAQKLGISGDLGAGELVGIGDTPTVSFTTGAGSLATGSTNLTGAVLVTSSGAVSFQLNWMHGGSAYAYPHFSTCFFTVAGSNSDAVKELTGGTTNLTASGSTTATGEYVGYLCTGS